MRQVTLSALVSLACILSGCHPPGSQPEIAGHDRPMAPAQTPAANLDGQKDASHNNNVEQTVWSGMSGGLNIRWTTQDLYVTSPDHSPVKVFSPFVENDFREFAAAQVITLANGEVRTLDCDYKRDLRLLSVVGNQISFEDVYYVLCGTHPDMGTGFSAITIDGGAVTDKKLTDYFPEEDILSALLGDRLIRGALKYLNITYSPRTISELMTLLARNDYRLGEADTVLPLDFLNHFAFHHIEGDKVAVRIGLPSNSVAGHAVHKQLGLLLTIPSELRQPLALAANKQQGFLMKDALMLSGDRTSSFSFKTEGKE